MQKLEGYGTASEIDLIAGHLWESGGASLLATGQWLAVFAGWTVAASFRSPFVLRALALPSDWDVNV